MMERFHLARGARRLFQNITIAVKHQQNLVCGLTRRDPPGMQLLRSADRNVKVLKSDSNIRWTRVRIVRRRREGHLILLKVEERSKSDIGQDEDGQKYLDESAQRVFLFLDVVLL